MTEWHPTAGLTALRERARVCEVVRSFFRERQVLEVETPTLSRAANPDPAIESFRVAPKAGRERFLHTSPEFAMKRLVAAGYGPVWQMCRVYRDGEAGKRHNPEFTLLEWYRPGFDEQALMAELMALMRCFLPGLPVRTVTFRQAFLAWAGFDPELISLATLQRRTEKALGWQSDERDEMLDLWLSAVIEKALPADELVFIRAWPANRAALAALEKSGSDARGTARRFEAYWAGMELANGYYELTDAGELRQRWQNDLRRRAARDQPTAPLDEALLAAQTVGLPACSGVALGVDRLLMGLLGTERISEVIAFPWDHA